MFTRLMLLLRMDACPTWPFGPRRLLGDLPIVPPAAFPPLDERPSEMLEYCVIAGRRCLSSPTTVASAASAGGFRCVRLRSGWYPRCSTTLGRPL